MLRVVLGFPLNVCFLCVVCPCILVRKDFISFRTGFSLNKILGWNVRILWWGFFPFPTKNTGHCFATWEPRNTVTLLLLSWYILELELGYLILLFFLESSRLGFRPYIINCVRWKSASQEIRFALGFLRNMGEQNTAYIYYEVTDFSALKPKASISLSENQSVFHPTFPF